MVSSVSSSSLEPWSLALHHNAAFLSTRYTTRAPCTGTPAYDIALPSTYRVSPLWYGEFTFGISTLNDGRLYSSTLIIADASSTFTVNDPLITPSGSMKSVVTVPYLSASRVFSATVFLFASSSRAVTLRFSSATEVTQSSLR